MNTGNTAGAMELTAAEKQIIELYRRADSHDKTTVKMILDRYNYRFSPQVIEGGAGKGRVLK